MNDYQISIVLLKRFISFMEELSPNERLWLIDQFNNFFCDTCGDEISNCVCQNDEN